MAKYHIMSMDSGGCARAFTGLAVSLEDFNRMLQSQKCHVCMRRSSGPRERFLYRVDNGAGEKLGTVTARHEGEAHSVAAQKYGAAGIKVRMV